MVTIFSTFCSPSSLFWQVLILFIKEHILSVHFVAIMGIFKLIKLYHYSLAEVSDWCSIPWIFFLVVCIRLWMKFENFSCCLKCGILKDKSFYTFNWLKLNPLHYCKWPDLVIYKISLAGAMTNFIFFQNNGNKVVIIMLQAVQRGIEEFWFIVVFSCCGFFP